MMPRSTAGAILAAAAAALPFTVVADGTYRSRPDLAPPQLNITIPAEGRTESGYLFVAPYAGDTDSADYGPLQSAPYILTDSGDLVWSGFTYFSVWAANFQASRWKGQDVLFSFEGSHNSLHGHGHGHHTLLNQQYETVRELRAGNHLLSDKHEFTIVNETTALYQIYHPLQKNLAAYGGDARQTWIVDARFQETEIESGKVIFEWHSLDHVSPDESALPLPLGQVGIGHNSSTAWDYFHINSVAKGDDGNYLVSGRHTSTIYKVNGTDGTIIWRLGGKSSDFELGPNVTFGFQHDARYHSPQGGNRNDDSIPEVISLFDNSVHGAESEVGGGGSSKEVRLYPFSRGKYITLDHQAKKATLKTAFHPPREPILARSQGSLQSLPGGNVLVGWGSEGQVTEYRAGGEPVFHAFLDSGERQIGLQNYRTFRYNWTGYSPETPAVFAEEVEGGAVVVYVSWNGDTRTDRWRFVWTQREGVKGWGEESDPQSVDVKRTGFETVQRLPVRTTAIGDIHAVALDADGRVLTKSEKVQAVRAFWLDYEEPVETFSEKAKQDVFGDL